MHCTWKSIETLESEIAKLTGKPLLFYAQIGNDSELSVYVAGEATLSTARTSSYVANSEIKYKYYVIPNLPGNAGEDSIKPVYWMELPILPFKN